MIEAMKRRVGPAVNTAMWLGAGIGSFVVMLFVTSLVDAILNLHGAPVSTYFLSHFGLAIPLALMAIASFGASAAVLDDANDLSSSTAYLTGINRALISAGGFLSVGMLAWVFEENHVAISDVLPAIGLVVGGYALIAALNANAHNQGPILRWLSHLCLAAWGYTTAIAALVLLGA